jgi:hypothetical protein
MRLDEIGEIDGWRCWLCDGPVDRNMSVNDPRGPSIDSRTTERRAKAKGTGLRFSERVRGQMAAAERLRSVPFDVDVKVPVRLQLGGVKTWAVSVTVRCTIAVDRLAATAKVVSRSCSAKVPFLFWRI